MPKVAVIGQGDCIGFELTIYNQQDKVRVIFQAYIEDITWLRGHTKCPRGHVISSIYHITNNEDIKFSRESSPGISLVFI